jgi:hypothetical protein
VSADYYMRLEQGREASPSHQFVASALWLDDEATDHMRRPCRRPTYGIGLGERRPGPPRRLRPSLLTRT